MRILLTTHHAMDRNLGAPGAAIALGEALQARGHDVRWLSWDDMPGWLGARGRELLFPEFVAGRLMRAKWRPDVVDATTGDGWLWAHLQRRLANRPLLVTRSHGLEHVFWERAQAEAEAGRAELGLATRLYHGRARLWEVRDSMRRSDRVVVANSDDLEYAVTRLGVARERIDTFANAVSDELLAVEPAPDPPAGTLRLAVVGSWTARKGIEFGIPALTTLLERHPGTSAILAGTAAGVEEVLARFPEALRPRIDVVPAYERAELPHLLRGAHVLLFPTLAEGQSLALLEGMACGLAPVTTPAGASTVARDDREALVVEPGDADALVAAVERLLSDPGRLGRLRARALETAGRHTWARSAEEAEALYAGGRAELRP